MNTKVLVVDDEFLIRMSLESGLSDLGHQVKTAETFSEGLALAESWRPDVVLLDNKLGGELGLEHIEDFKKLDEDIQIIMITAYGSVSQAVEAMKRLNMKPSTFYRKVRQMEQEKQQRGAV